MTRFMKITTMLREASSESAVVADAFSEIIQLLRQAAAGKDISVQADLLLKEFDRRDIISSDSYSIVDRLHTVLNSTSPPIGITPVHWDNLKIVRVAFGKIIDANHDKVEVAMRSEQNRNWFIGQLMKTFHSSFGVPALSALVFKTFMGAAR